MPNQFWYILAGVVFVVVNIVLWLYQHRCKVKGIKPQPPFNRFKKRAKRISKWTDFFIIATILLVTVLFCGSMLFIFNITTPQDIPPEYIPMDKRLLVSVYVLILSMYFTLVVLMASFLSPFQKNITLTKRLIVVAMCCVPIIFGVLFCIFDDSHNHSFYFKLILGGLFPVFFINWPVIFLGKPFGEFISGLYRKIPLPWFQLSK
jgi:hypothetical protein